MTYDKLGDAYAYCLENHIPIPPDLKADLISLCSVKSLGDIDATMADYHDSITQAIIDYFEGGRRVQDARGDMKRAMSTAFVDGFETGWIDGGGELPVDESASDWLAAKQEAEFGFIDMLFAQMRDLKKEDDKDFDYFSFATLRADGYTATLKGVYSEGKIRAAGNKMLTFTGEDGSPDHICQSIGGTCVRLMGQRHRASWWIAHDLIPRPGNPNYDCGGWNCHHRLEDDDGNVFGGYDGSETKALKWEEEQHPRDESGRFASGGSSGETGGGEGGGSSGGGGNSPIPEIAQKQIDYFPYYTSTQETMYIYKDGEQVTKIVGDKLGVDLGDDKAIFENSVMLHNHPSDRVDPKDPWNRLTLTFSEQDIEIASGWNVKQIVATGEKMTYTMGRPDNGWPDHKAAFQKTIENLSIGEELAATITKYRYESGNLENANNLSRLIWKEYASVTGAYYTETERVNK